MRRYHALEVAAIAVGALASTGCGQDPGIESGTVPFKSAPADQLKSMTNEMQKNMRDRPYLKKDEATGKPAADSGGTGESKPDTGSKPATKGG